MERKMDVDLAAIKSDLREGEQYFSDGDDCRCEFNWEFENGRLSDGVTGEECPNVMELWVPSHGEPIARYTYGEDKKILIPDLSRADIPDDVWEALDVERTFGPHSEEHFYARRESLVEWLVEQEQFIPASDGDTLSLRPAREGERVSSAQAEAWVIAYLDSGSVAVVAPENTTLFVDQNNYPDLRDRFDFADASPGYRDALARAAAKDGVIWNPVGGEVRITLDAEGNEVFDRQEIWEHYGRWCAEARDWQVGVNREAQETLASGVAPEAVRAELERKGVGPCDLAPAHREALDYHPQPTRQQEELEL